MQPQSIESHGVIGDLRTVALVAKDGTVDFFCFPRFDSPTVFAALLDPDQGGSFRIDPGLKDCREKQLYIPDTNILITRFLAEGGVAEIVDFMPVGEAAGARTLVRVLMAVRGEVRFQVRCAPRFDYGRAKHRVEEEEKAVVFRAEGGAALRLRAATSGRPLPLRIDGPDAAAEFTLRAGERAAFVLEDAGGAASAASPTASTAEPQDLLEFAAKAYRRTENFWREWVGRCSYKGRWREMVNRSALILKLLTYAPSGAMVAAPTFGLPETTGGVRNWDYRYTWIRDTSFAMHALMELGYYEEAAAFMEWIHARCHELDDDGGRLQVMYGVTGETCLSEEELKNFKGYNDSRPVRIGNEAYAQLQLDIHGELLDAVNRYDEHVSVISFELWHAVQRIVEWVSANWRRPDRGIWEIRGGEREFLYSKIMCWTALDRALRIAERRSYPAPVAAWRRTRDDIYTDVFTNFWNAERGTFVQYRGGSTVDAATLMMPITGMISPADQRWCSTLAAIEKDLAYDSLVYRYQGDSALEHIEGAEGTFSICTFWLIHCLADRGELGRARLMFEKMLGYANHLGLFSEELGSVGEHLGNFPQAFTHLGLIRAAAVLDRALSAAGHPS